MGRVVTRHYRDPLDLIWLEAARQIGFRVARSSDVFASSDGRGTITIASAEHLDADDSLAQMIFHELCHSLVQGPESFEVTDWGLENADDRDVELEHACLRTQAHIAGRHGLREVLAPTTDFRRFYDKLAADPLAPREAASSMRAVIAIRRANRAPWAPHLEIALAQTRAIAVAGAGSWPDDSVLATIAPAAPRHDSDLWGIPRKATPSCGQCAWRAADGLCRQAASLVAKDSAACERFESAISCEGCGACCREGYDSVTIDADDPVLESHPELVVDRSSYLELARDENRCAALEGELGSFRCRIYDDRPRCCRELERGGEHCLTARRRVGLSL